MHDMNAVAVEVLVPAGHVTRTAHGLSCTSCLDCAITRSTATASAPPPPWLHATPPRD